MKIFETGRKFLLIMILLSPLALHLGSCKKADTVSTPANTSPTPVPTPIPIPTVGNKLVGSGAIGNAFQGSSVSISADSNNLVLSGYGDNSEKGAIWIFNPTNNAWNQVGDDLLCFYGSTPQALSGIMSCKGINRPF